MRTMASAPSAGAAGEGGSCIAQKAWTPEIAGSEPRYSAASPVLWNWSRWNEVTPATSGTSKLRAGPRGAISSGSASSSTSRVGLFFRPNHPIERLLRPLCSGPSGRHPCLQMVKEVLPEQRRFTFGVVRGRSSARTRLPLKPHSQLRRVRADECPQGKTPSCYVVLLQGAAERCNRRSIHLLFTDRRGEIGHQPVHSSSGQPRRGCGQRAPAAIS